jgi:hypothetical protein
MDQAVVGGPQNQEYPQSGNHKCNVSNNAHTYYYHGSMSMADEHIFWCSSKSNRLDALRAPAAKTKRDFFAHKSREEEEVSLRSKWRAAGLVTASGQDKVVAVLCLSVYGGRSPVLGHSAQATTKLCWAKRVNTFPVM